MRVTHTPADGLRYWLALRPDARAAAESTGLGRDGVQALLAGEHRAPTLTEISDLAMAIRAPVGDLGYRSAVTASGTEQTQGRTRTKVIASNEEVARDGDIVDTASLVLESYDKNPVVLWAHNYDEQPIGKAETTVENAQMLQLITWDEAEDNARGRSVARQYREGFLNAVSLGWIPGEVVARSELPEDHPHHGPSGYVHRNNDVLEVSAVPVPSLQSALAVERALSSGVKHELSVSEFLRMLDVPEVRRRMEALMLAQPSEQRGPLDRWLHR